MSDWGLYPWFEERALIHPDDLALVQVLQPYGLVLEIVERCEDFVRLRYGDWEFRGHPSLLRPLDISPKRIGDRVVIQGRRSGEVVNVRWHYAQHLPFYELRISGKRKSKRYWDSDFRPMLELIEGYGERMVGPFDAVALHPTADEVEWLRAHDMRPEDCVHVDVYWAGSGFFALIAIAANQTEAFTTYWVSEGDMDIPHRFFVSLSTGPITFAIIGETLTWLSRWMDEYGRVLRYAWFEGARRIADFDICRVRPT